MAELAEEYEVGEATIFRALNRLHARPPPGGDPFYVARHRLASVAAA
jgi:hypothetical protein